MLMTIHDCADNVIPILGIPKHAVTALRSSLKRLDKRRCNGLFDVNPGRSSADLTAQHDESQKTFLDGDVHVTIRKDDGGGFPTEFKRDSFKCFRSSNVNLDPCRHTPCEGDLSGQYGVWFVGGTLLTSGCSERRRPVFPSPMTQLKTPGGKPASLKSLPRYIVERQFLSLGFAIKVFPVARAGAHFAAKSKRGTLKEVIPTQTTNGS